MPRKKSENREPRPGGKEAVGFRLTPDARRLIGTLASRLGVTQAAVVELGVRELAKREGVE